MGGLTASETRFTILACLLQIIFLVFFGVFTSYDEPQARPVTTTPNATQPANGVNALYPLWQDVHGMMFIGFGFLMAFLKRYGYSSVGLNFFLGALVLQWATLVLGFFKGQYDQEINLSVDNLLTADFAAAAVMISFGAVLGKVSVLQLLVMAFWEIMFFAVSEAVGVKYLKAEDVGGSIFVHTFGAYFGLAMSRTLSNRTRHARHPGSDKEGSVYHSDLFSIFGTIVLWLYWPSFNAALKSGDQRHRAIINTYYSLSACAVVTFCLASLFSKKEKLDMVLIQNATLAGGVAVGASANFLIQPWAAQVLGSVAALVSVFGYLALQPMLQKEAHLHDTCGVHNLHGMPGILGAIAGAAATASISTEKYGNSLYQVYPAMAPENATDPELVSLVSMGYDISAGEGRSQSQQAGFQLAALATTICIAVVGGVFTGFVMRLRFLSPPGDVEEEMFEDQQHWEMNPGAPEPEQSLPTQAAQPGQDLRHRAPILAH